MPHPTPEQLYTTQIRGLRATADLSIALPLLAERQQALITQAINDFSARPSKMDGTQALLFVAALAENRRLEDDLKRTESDGRKAGEKLQS